MWTRGKDRQHLGKFAFELFDGAGALVERRGGFDTAQEADRAAERAQRALLAPAPTMTDSDWQEIDALLSELDA